MIESAKRDREQLAGKDVCVIGGGDAAAENALLLAEVCPTVTLVHRGRKLRARREFTEQLHTHHCVTVFPESNVRRILGNDRVEAVEIERAGAIKPFQMAVQGVVIRIGFEPNTDFARINWNWMSAATSSSTRVTRRALKMFSRLETFRIRWRRQSPERSVREQQQRRLLPQDSGINAQITPDNHFPLSHAARIAFAVGLAPGISSIR
jgi:hypothetical protein